MSPAAFLVTLVAVSQSALPGQGVPPSGAGPGIARPAPGAAGGHVRDGGERASERAPGTAVLTGTITTMGGQPAVGAQVSVTGGEAGMRMATTDANGRFTIDQLRAGRYMVNVSKPGHVNLSYGQRRTNGGGTPIPLADGERREIAMQLPRGAVITGMVLDERGEPAIHVDVRALRYVNAGGQRRTMSGPGDQTDDRGIYRLHSLQPGEYAVCATLHNRGPRTDAERIRNEIDGIRRGIDSAPPAARQQMSARLRQLLADLPPGDDGVTGYAPTCFPDARSNAPTVAVAAGDERSGVDIQLQLTPMARIEGTVAGPQDVPLTDVQVMITNTDEFLGELTRSGASVEAGGRFVFRDLPPGRYSLTARTMRFRRPAQEMVPVKPGTSDLTLWANLDIEVNGADVTGVVMDLQRGVQVTGQVVFQPTSKPPPRLTEAQVALSPAAPGGMTFMFGSNLQVNLDASGRFTLDNVVPGKYRLSAFVPGSQGWVMESVTADGEDALDFPLDVTAKGVSNVSVQMGDRITELSGTVVDGHGRIAADHTVLLFAADAKYWVPQSRRIRSARVDADGRYVFRSVPPGEYRLVPVLDLEPASWFDREVLEQLEPSSVRVTIGEGEKKIEHVRVR